jgi:hypothetical protein
MDVKSTRLRYVSSSSPQLLEAFLNALPFKVEIKSITAQGKRWFCWFVLPDNVSHKDLDKAAEIIEVNLSSVDIEDV